METPLINIQDVIDFADLSVKGAEVYQFNSFDAFTDHFKHQSFSETTFLVKASRGMALERILEYL